MKPPDHVIVGPLNYALEVDENAINAASHEEKAGLLGCANHVRLQIIIRPGMAPDVEAEIVLHEVLHAINDVTGLKMRLDADDEEDAVNSTAPLLLDVLRRNPELVAYLTRGNT